MANIRSARKRMRQNEKRRLRNRMIRSRVATAVKAAQAARSQKPDEAMALAAAAIRALDKALTKGILHKNTVARKKSALARRRPASAKLT